MVIVIMLAKGSFSMCQTRCNDLILVNWKESRIKGTIKGYGIVKFRHNYRFFYLLISQKIDVTVCILF
jgi:hypothetical protein